MRMHFVVPLMTLLSLVAANDRENLCNLASDKICTCGPQFHSVVALTDIAIKRTFCGGTLINNRQVMTLAQCVSGRNPRDFKVLVKLYNGEPESIYNVKSIEFHTENYEAGRDIAIVNIVEQLNEKDSEGIVCLPFCYPTQLFAGAGFRTMGLYRDPDEKRDILSNELVSMNLDGACLSDGEHVRDDIMCMDERGIDEFYGGEPVFWKINDQVQMQIGIIQPRVSRDDEKFSVVLIIGPLTKWIESLAPKGFSYCKYL